MNRSIRSAADLAAPNSEQRFERTRRLAMLVEAIDSIRDCRQEGTTRDEIITLLANAEFSLADLFDRLERDG